MHSGRGRKIWIDYQSTVVRQQDAKAVVVLLASGLIGDGCGPVVWQPD
jgi:hypothetical protein